MNVTVHWYQTYDSTYQWHTCDMNVTVYWYQTYAYIWLLIRSTHLIYLTWALMSYIWHVTHIWYILGVIYLTPHKKHSCVAQTSLSTDVTRVTQHMNDSLATWPSLCIDVAHMTQHMNDTCVTWKSLCKWCQGKKLTHHWFVKQKTALCIGVK